MCSWTQFDEDGFDERTMPHQGCMQEQQLQRAGVSGKVISVTEFRGKMMRTGPPNTLSRSLAGWRFTSNSFGGWVHSHVSAIKLPNVYQRLQLNCRQRRAGPLSTRAALQSPTKAHAIRQGRSKLPRGQPAPQHAAPAPRHRSARPQPEDSPPSSDI